MVALIAAWVCQDTHAAITRLFSRIPARYGSARDRATYHFAGYGICSRNASVLSLREENAVAFAPERGEIGKRGICRVGFEFEILRVC